MLSWPQSHSQGSPQHRSIPVLLKGVGGIPTRAWEPSVSVARDKESRGNRDLRTDSSAHGRSHIASDTWKSRWTKTPTALVPCSLGAEGQAVPYRKVASGRARVLTACRPSRTAAPRWAHVGPGGLRAWNAASPHTPSPLAPPRAGLHPD